MFFGHSVCKGVWSTQCPAAFSDKKALSELSWYVKIETKSWHRDLTVFQFVIMHQLHCPLLKYNNFDYSWKHFELHFSSSWINRWSALFMQHCILNRNKKIFCIVNKNILPWIGCNDECALIFLVRVLILISVVHFVLYLFAKVPVLI